MNFENFMFVFERNDIDWKIIEKPPKEIKELMRQIERVEFMFERIFMPRVISTMPDIIPLESSIFSGIEPRITFNGNDKKTRIFVFVMMSMMTEKKEI